MKYTPLENLSWEAFVAILNRAHTTHRDREITVGYYLPIAVREVLQRIPQQEGISSEIVCPALKSTVLGIFPTNVR